MERLYRAKADSGRDYITFLFKSENKGNSNKNKEDARKAYKKVHGHSIEIISTERAEFTGEKVY